MPSKGKSEWNREYYDAHREELAYQAKIKRRDAKLFKCGCGACVKDYSSNKANHRRSQNHQLWAIKEELATFLVKHKMFKAATHELRMDMARTYIRQHLERGIGYALMTTPERLQQAKEFRNKTENKMFNMKNESAERIKKAEEAKEAKEAQPEPEPEVENIIIEKPSHSSYDPLAKLSGKTIPLNI